jgi:hypothetical protein
MIEINIVRLLSARGEDCAVISFKLASAEIIQFSLDESSAQRAKLIREEYTVKMIIFMQYHPGFISAINLVMKIPVLIIIVDVYYRFTLHLFTNTGETETTFVHRYLLSVPFGDLRVDECLPEALHLRVIICKRLAVNNKDSD